ncbi:hypothetical protein PACTADRAFT_40970 [Pachysolen tannophilus NRRL Y-2460]|uniref:Adenylate cyclase n=1 Tax=Pachysolen tannophilus NRRL Y-2460 TaxID=669874 RepID=A0A1E4TWG7_PACTA|nr:hypothetical protein PACTADRAFT_40970 [Pachysolen tannophilus NRRL Y-2460]
MTAPSDSFRATKAKNNENSESRRSSRVAETKSLAQAPPESPKTDKKPIASSVPSISRRSVIRVFKEDNSFTTIPCEIEITTAELIPKLKKKFFFNKADDYQLTLRTGGLSRALEPFEKPLKIQIHYLLLSGYTVNDKLDLLGREDLSYLVKFSIEKCDFKQLSDEQKNHITKDFIHVNLSDLQLQSVPLVLYQRTFDIESLDISRNPSMAIPLDFIQACNNLTKLIYSGNRAHKIPSNIFEASKLTYLDLKINFLSEIPSQIESLSNLTTLQLSCNQLSSLPKSFGNLKKLNFLNLSSNNFKVYPEIVSELENLKELDLSYNELKQIPISISHLSQLEKLNFSANKLTKELPAYLGTLVKLKFLDLRYNNITNIESLTALPELEVLYTTSNNITQFDDELQKVRLFELNRNPLTSITVKNHLETLVILDLSKAKLTSLTANFFTNIPNLEKVILDNNHLVTLPSDICSLKRLVYLSCVRNNLSSLPPGISSLTSLQYLDLHLNNINVLSPEIWNLSSLSILNLSSNLLQDFPKPAANFFSSRITEVDNSLLYLSISDNRIDDQSLQVFSLFSRLKSLNLSYNEIIEIPPGTLKKMDSLTYLYLSGNKLSSLPSDDLEHLQNLMILHLNGNRFHSLPSELSKISHLSVLDVGSNQLKYNISNWPYDWNWNWNGDLKYLNFSGNKRLEIKPSHNKDVTLHGDLDSFLGLKNLKVLGLMDVTLITQKVPDQTVASRIRTTASEFSRFGYGISDTLGSSDGVTTRDVVLDKFRNNENEILISIFDGKNGDDKQGHKIAKIIQETFAMIFADELKKDESSIYDALRRSFLTMNREINSIIIKSDASTFSSVTPAHRTSTTYDLTSHDGLCGCCATVIYIKDKTLYTANIGDTMAMLTRSNGEHLVLTTEHLPYSQGEYDRIRATGGFVNSDGKLDGTVDVSRAVGFFNLLPHIHSGPDISVLELSPSDEMIAIGTKELWKYVSYDFAVDVIRQEKNNPMLAAEKLRDYAISYGASDKVTAVVISLNKDNSVVLRRKAEENENLLKFRRNKSSLPEDTALRRLEQEIEPPVGEVAMVFTDIKNSTLLWDNFPIAMRSAIKTHNSIMRRQLRIVGGYEVKTEGDAFMVSFPTATSALLWCFSVQQQLLIADWPTEIIESDQGCEISDEANNLIFRGLSVRMGAHWGIPVCETDIITKRMDYFGPMVNRTSRISGVADGGQITLSSDFLFEFNKIKACHDKSKTTSIREAYGEEYGNMAVTLDKEVTQLENIGWVIENIGEMKLKGLETPESITLIYARPLASRFKFNEADTPANSSVSVNGILNTDLFWKLRTLGLRLEQIASYLSAGVSDRDCKNYSTFETTTTNTLSNRMTNIDFLTLMDHIITRIESIVLMIKVRQELGISNLILSNNDVYAMVAKEFQTLKELKRQLT